MCECESVCACLFLPEKPEVSAGQKEIPEGLEALQEVHPLGAGASPSCPAQGEARGCPALGASPVDLASVAWLGHLQPCGPGQPEQLVSSLSGGDVK